MELRKRKWKNFTLLELLIVIAIITILAGLLLPALKKARETTYKIACASNLKQMAVVFSNYISDQNDMLPGAYGNPGYWGKALYNAGVFSGMHCLKFQGILTEYSPQIMSCPIALKNGKQLDITNSAKYQYGISFYLVNVSSGVKINVISNPSQKLILLETKSLYYDCCRTDILNSDADYRHLGSTNLLFVDGHVGFHTYPLPPYNGTANPPNPYPWGVGL